MQSQGLWPAEGDCLGSTRSRERHGWSSWLLLWAVTPLLPSLAPLNLHLIPYFFSILKTKLPIEKSKVFTCRFHVANPSQPANPSVPGSPGLCGKSPGLGPMPRTQLCSQPKAWRSHLLKGPSLGFLPGTYSCLLFIFWGDQPSRWYMAVWVMRVLKCMAFNNSARTYSSCHIRIQLENIKMNCCRLENQLGKRGKTSGVTLRIWKFILHI